MKFNFKFYLFLATLLSLNIGFSQAKSVKQDTTQVYQKIEAYSKKSKFTTFLHKLIFEPSKIKTSNPIRKREPKVYTKYEGKIIRNIHIETLDPFGYSVSDSTNKVGNWGERFGNQIHIKTSQLAVKNLLLFKRNKPLDPLEIKESERLIRQQRFVREVLITTEPIPKNADSVDIYIRVLDSWSLIPKGSISSSRTAIGFHEKNFLGTGHEFNNKFTKRLTD